MESVAARGFAQLPEELMHFEVLELNGEFFWRLLDADGRELDCSARRYATRRQAMQAVRRLRDCAAAAPIVMRRKTA